MNNLHSKKIAEDIIKFLDPVSWKTTIEIANEVDAIYGKLIPLLVAGRETVFSYDPPNKWKIRKKCTDTDIKEYLDSVEAGKVGDESVVERFREKNEIREYKERRKQRKFASGEIGVEPKEIDYSTEDNGLRAKLRNDSFSYGRKKEYKGPDGQYWNDPSFRIEKDNER